MPEWLVERGIGEDRALLVDGDRVLAARMRWPGELFAGDTVEGRLVSRTSGSSRGMVRTANEDVLVDRLPPAATEGSVVSITIVRAATAERGRTKYALGRLAEGAATSAHEFARDGMQVRRFPTGAWEEIWTAASARTVAFSGGALLFDVTPGMTVIDVDGTLPARDLALRAVPALAGALRRFDLGGSIAIDFPTLGAKGDRQAVDAALATALAGWPHERTAMNGFGLVQIVARLDGPSILHRLSLHRAQAAARYLLREAEALEDAGAIEIAAHPLAVAALRDDWLAELARRTGREVRTRTDPSLALTGGHAQIVPR